MLLLIDFTYNKPQEKQNTDALLIVLGFFLMTLYYSAYKVGFDDFIVLTKYRHLYFYYSFHKQDSVFVNSCITFSALFHTTLFYTAKYNACITVPHL